MNKKEEENSTSKTIEKRPDEFISIQKMKLFGEKLLEKAKQKNQNDFSDLKK